MSYKVSPVTDAAASASISTPVALCVRTLVRIALMAQIPCLLSNWGGDVVSGAALGPESLEIPVTVVVSVNAQCAFRKPRLKTNNLVRTLTA